MTTADEINSFSNFIGISYIECVSKNNFKIDKKTIYYQIINLNEKTHWVLFIKIDNICYYYDSFGAPPFESLKLQTKLKKCDLYYNIKQYQRLDEITCGEWCFFELFRIFLL